MKPPPATAPHIFGNPSERPRNSLRTSPKTRLKASTPSPADTFTMDLEPSPVNARSTPVAALEAATATAAVRRPGQRHGHDTANVTANGTANDTEYDTAKRPARKALRRINDTVNDTEHDTEHDTDRGTLIKIIIRIKFFGCARERMGVQRARPCPPRARRAPAAERRRGARPTASRRDGNPGKLRLPGSDLRPPPRSLKGVRVEKSAYQLKKVPKKFGGFVKKSYLCHRQQRTATWKRLKRHDSRAS